MIDRILSLLVALSLALLVWLYARSRDQEILDNVTLPVQVSLAEGQAEHYSLEVNGAGQAVVSFSGPSDRIRELRGEIQRNELHVEVVLTVPEEHRNESRYSDTVHIDASQVPAPPGVTPIVSEGRNRISVTVRRMVTRPLPVRFDALQEETSGPVVLDPAVVLVTGPQEVLDHIRAIPTMPSELPMRPANAPPGSTAVGRVALVQELEGRPVRSEPSKVTVKAPPQLRKEYVLPDVPIHFLCQADFTLRPEFFNDRDGRVTLHVIGPIQDEAPKVYAFLDLTHGRFESGSNHEPLQIQFLQKDFQLIDDQLRVVTFKLDPADFVPKGFSSSPP
ncbi:MAG TPA: hypothetical protein DDY78_01450 [Planctomycetales bacterium]|jgi:hypothetical protein|nr:hypothetical protein [Planctomycetales bacterium]